MRLPQIDVGPVQSTGGVDEAIAATRELGHKQAQMWGAVGNLGQATEQFGFAVAAGMTRVQTAQARADLALKDQQLKEQFANQTMYTKDDLIRAFGNEESIPPEVISNAGGLDTVTTDANTGEQVSKPRSDIPRWAVQHYIYQKQMSQAVTDTAERISIPGWKNEYVRAGMNEVASHTEALKGQSMKEFKDWEIAAQTVNATRLADGGDFNGAAEVIKMSPMTPAQKEFALHKNEVQRAEYPINQVMLEEDHQGIQQMIAGLQSGDAKFDVETSSGKKIPADVSALSEQQRREYARTLERYDKRLTNDEKNGAQQAQRDFEDEFERRLLDAHRQGNQRGVRQIIRALPLDQLSAEKAKNLIGMMDTWDRQAKEGKPIQDPASWYAFERAGQLASQGSDMKVTDPKTGQPIDIRTADLPYYAQRDNWTPGTYAQVKGMQEKLLKGKTEGVTDVVENRIIKNALTSMGHSQSAVDAEGGDVEARAAAAFDFGTAREFVRQEEAKLGHKMKEPELEDAISRWAATSKVDSGHWYRPDATYSDIPKDQARAITRVAGYLRDHGVAGVDTTQAGVTELFKKKLEPQFSSINDAWASSYRKEAGEDLTYSKRVGIAADILLNKQRLIGELESKGVKSPTDSQITNWYFQTKGWGSK